MQRLTMCGHHAASPTVYCQTTSHTRLSTLPRRQPRVIPKANGGPASWLCAVTVLARVHTLMCPLPPYSLTPCYMQRLVYC
jgi:hypothetical protein